MKKTHKLFLLTLPVVLFLECNHYEESQDDTQETGIDKEESTYLNKTKDSYIFELPSRKLEVVPSVGGRIRSLSYREKQLLSTMDINEVNWGSTFWTSPQSDWGWPPLAVLDSEPYTIEERGDTLVLTSEVDPKTGYKVKKQINVDRSDDSFVITYSIYNSTDSIRTVAPWEITRVPTGGTTFFPKGQGAFISGQFNELPITVDENNVVWFKYDSTKILNDHHKLMGDGSEGWMAFTYDGLILIKKFEDIPENVVAEGEGEIEIFANKEKTYIEIEQQGGSIKLDPHGHLDWKVKWYPEELPEKGLDGTKLVSFVRNRLKG